MLASVCLLVCFSLFCEAVLCFALVLSFSVVLLFSLATALAVLLAWKNKVKPGNVFKFVFSLESEIAPVPFALVLLFVSLFCFWAVSTALSFEDVVVVLLTASVDGECNTPPPYSFRGLVL